MHDLAHRRGGLCLSDEYKNGKTKLLWQCGRSHQWNATGSSVERGCWCPICHGTPKLTIEQMRALASKRGGKCLSDEYVDSTTVLLWKCIQGHQWYATPGSVKNSGTWCRKCAGVSKLDISDMQRIAAERGGLCLSPEYGSNKDKLLWECSSGHHWDATGDSVKRGSWCPDCSGHTRLSIEDMRQLAHSYGGKCLSEKYTDARTKLLWECVEGHVWETKPLIIRNLGSWCPHCLYKNEQECRAICEHLTGKKFPSCWPEWLEGKQLDGYCQELSIGMEHQGRQHYNIVKWWHKNGQADLDAQQERDAEKEAACEDNDVALIVIPYWIEDKLSFITGELRKIYRKRHQALMTARMTTKAVSPVFTIADNDRIWKDLGL